MQLPPKAAQMKPKKAESVAGYHDGTDDDRGHGKHEQYINCRQQNALRGVLSPKQGAMPLASQRMVQDEQQAQRNAQTSLASRNAAHALGQPA